jgi:hypothetical protein
MGAALPADWRRSAGADVKRSVRGGGGAIGRDLLAEVAQHAAT